MKIILAILAIALAAVAFALRDRDVASTDSQSSILATVGGSSMPLPLTNGAGALVEAPPDNRRGGEGADLLRVASDRLDRYNSVATSIRYRANLFDSELIGSGMYQQAGQGGQRKFRLELKTQLGDKVSGQLQVCDAENLWTYRDKPTGAQLERIDLRRVRAAQNEAAKLPPSSPVEELAIGGLPKLFAGLRANFRPIQTEAGYLNNVPMWSIELEWIPSVLAALVEEQRERIAAGSSEFSKLPQMPERVMVYLGHEDLFPRRIEFRRRATASSEPSNVDPRNLGQGSAGQGRAGDFLPAVTVEFTDVRLNEPIDPRQFQYGPAGATDVTDVFLQNRGLPIVR